MPVDIPTSIAENASTIEIAITSVIAAFESSECTAMTITYVATSGEYGPPV
jgi:hypothetical protein